MPDTPESADPYPEPATPPTGGSPSADAVPSGDSGAEDITSQVEAGSVSADESPSAQGPADAPSTADEPSAAAGGSVEGIPEGGFVRWCPGGAAPPDQERVAEGGSGEGAFVSSGQGQVGAAGLTDGGEVHVVGRDAAVGALEIERDRGWLVKAVLYGVGVVFIGIGVHGIWADPRNVPVAGWGKWFLGGVLIHDLLFAPVVLLLAALVVRIPLPYRRILQAALAVGGSLTLVALPFVLGYGRRPDNPSQLPLPYGRNLLELLIAIAVVAVAMVAVSFGMAIRDSVRKRR